MTSLVTIASVLPRTMAIDAQLTDWEMRGEKVAMYRNYYDGDHPANLTPQMRQLLRINRRTNSGAHVRNGGGEFNANYMQLVVDTMTDRIDLSTVSGDNDAVTAWSQEVLENNRIDGLQGDVHEATIRDGETFVMTSWNNETQQVEFTHEQAYDGISGMLVLYRSNDVPDMVAAIKIWCITASEAGIANTVRVNAYLPDRIIKLQSVDGSSFMPYVDPNAPVTEQPGVYPWVDRTGQPLGIPVTHFMNRGRQNQGLSELENAIPLQDALNRTLHSLVMTEELTAFQIKWMKGATPPADVTPGMWVGLAVDGMTTDMVADVGVLPAGDISQILNAYDKLTGEIGKITRTPAPEFAGGDNASGEALKQREIGLIGKVKRFHIKAGNAWEDVMQKAWTIQEAFGTAPPAWTRFYAEWGDPEIRNDQVTIQNAIALAPYVDERTILEIVADIYGWDSEKIDKILEAKQGAQAQRIAALVSGLPTYGNFTPPGEMTTPAAMPASMPTSMPMTPMTPITSMTPMPKMSQMAGMANGQG